MKRNMGTDRRTFLRALSAASVWSAVRPGTAVADTESVTTYAYVGSLQPAGLDGIEVFRVDSNRWTYLQRIPCHAPASLVLHPHRPFLYVANAVALHEGLPQGTVEVFAIDLQSGALSFVQRRALSLSGTEPRSMAIAPDGRYLVVAAYGGGAYNVLPIEQNGTLGSVRRIFKELGRGIHAEYQTAAHPHTVVFDAKGRFVLASDFGCDQLSVFGLNEDGELRRKSKTPVEPGAGPGSMVLHPEGSLLYVRHELNGAISCHRYRQIDGIIEKALQSVRLPCRPKDEFPMCGGLAMDSRGRFLYATSGSGITVWAIDSATGSLSLEYRGGNGDALHLAQDGKTLHAIDGRGGSVLQMRPNAASGRWDDIAQVASVASPASLALLTC